jgi:hypothetical protein
MQGNNMMVEVSAELIKNLSSFLELSKEKKRDTILEIVALDREQQKSIFESISDLEQKKQKSIFESISDLEQNSLQKIYIKFLMRIYKGSVNTNKIKKDFLEKYLLKFCQVIGEKKDKNKNRDGNEEKAKNKDRNEKVDIHLVSEFRETLYRLLRKIEKDDKKLYTQYKLETAEKYFSDLAKKYTVQEFDDFKDKKEKIQDEIKKFKTKVLSTAEYRESLQKISKNRIYIEEYKLFDLLLYISESLPQEDLLSENNPRYSYAFFCKHQKDHNDLIMLNELFANEGFVWEREKEKGYLISFETLVKFTYKTDITVKDIDTYRQNPNILYIYYTLSKNKTLCEDVKASIKDNLQHLPYLYPYSSDVMTIIGHIENSIYTKTREFSQNKDITFEKLTLHDFYLYDGFDLSLLEESSKLIQQNKSRSLYEYFTALENFLLYTSAALDNMGKSGLNLRNDRLFLEYIFYIFEVFENDYRICYYKEYYFQDTSKRIRKMKYISPYDYEVKLFTIYLSLQGAIVNIAFYVLNYVNSKSKEDTGLLSKIKSIYTESFKLLEKELTYDVYWNLRESLYPKGMVIYLEYRVLKLGAKLSSLFNDYKKQWKEFWKILKKQDEEELDKIYEKGYIFDSFKKYNEYKENLELGRDVIAFYLSPKPQEEDSKLEKYWKDWEIFSKNWELVNDKNS